MRVISYSQKDKIIDVASQIIIDKGIENTSLNEIAKGVGISKGTLYYYYPSKDELIYEITIQHLEKLSSDLITLTNTDNKKSDEKEMLNLLFNRIIQDETRNKLHLFLIQGAITSNTDLIDKFKKAYISWKNRLVVKLQKTIKSEHNDNHSMAKIFLAIIDGLVIQHHLGLEIEDINKLTNVMIKAL